MDASALGRAFGDRFGEAPTHLVWAPGQVLLMGEQLAANGLPVLGMAMNRGLRMVLRPREDGRVRIEHTDPGAGAASFVLDVSMEPGPRDDWTRVVRTVARVMARRFAVWRGFDAVVDSDVPSVSGSGHRESMAVAVALALSELGEVGLAPLDLVDVLTSSADGSGRTLSAAGLALCLVGREGQAMSVAVDPLRTRSLLLPPDWRIVLAAPGGGAHGGLESWSVVLDQRASECREALALLADASPVAGGKGGDPTFGAIFRAAGGPRRSLASAEGALTGSLLKRFRHLATEAERVGEAEDALLLADIVSFGMLMDAAHGSLRGDYLVSSAVLDALAVAALEGGAAGAHLVGLGDAGALVALADTGTVDGVVAALEEVVSQGGPGGTVFVARASDGARVEGLSS
jgi:galactokinase